MTPEHIAIIVIVVVIGMGMLMLGLLLYFARESHYEPIKRRIRADDNWIFTFKAKIKDDVNTIYKREVLEGTLEEIKPQVLERVAEMQAIVFKELNDRKLTDDDVSMMFKYEPVEDYTF